MKKDRKLFIIRRVFSLLTVFLFTAAITVTGVLFFVVPKSESSEIERRKLAEMPEFTSKALASGKFTDDYSVYYSDNFAFRDKLVKTSFALEDLRGIRYGNVKVYGSDNNTNTDKGEISSIDEKLYTLKKSALDNVSVKVGEDKLPAKPVQTIIQNESEYADLTQADLEGEKRGSLFMIGTTALEIFYGNSNVAADYSNTVNSFRYSLPADVKVYCEVVPTHFEFGLPSKYKTSVGRREKPFIDDIYSNLDANVYAVDAYSKIEQSYNNGDYDYFRTDHHWTARGAYAAYTAFAETAGFTPSELSDFESGRIDKFLGTFYSSTYDKNLEDNPDYVEYFLPFTEYEMTNYESDGVTHSSGKAVYTNVSGESNGYLAFTGGDHPMSVIKTKNATGRKIIVYKESYGNAFVPFLIANFDEIYVADIRSFPFSSLSFIDDKGITDVLFLNNIMSACTPARVMNIMNLLK